MTIFIIFVFNETVKNKNCDSPLAVAGQTCPALDDPALNSTVAPVELQYKLNVYPYFIVILFLCTLRYKSLHIEID